MTAPYVPMTAADLTRLDPKVYVDPVSKKALPILVQVAGGGGTTGGATEATLTALLDAIQMPTITTMYPSTAVKTTAGTVMVGAASITATNTGAGNAVFAGATLVPGAYITFDSPPNAQLAAIPYVATGTQLQLVALSALVAFTLA